MAEMGLEKLQSEGEYLNESEQEVIDFDFKT